MSLWGSSKPKQPAVAASAASSVSPVALAGPARESFMTVGNCPNTQLALTNMAFLNKVDFKQNLFSEEFVSGAQVGFAEVGDCVLTIAFHEAIESGQIGLNAVQRRGLRVSTGDSIKVKRFVLPRVEFNLAICTFEIEFMSKSKAKQEQIDAPSLSKDVLRKFGNQVFSVGQKSSFEYQGTNYILTFNEGVVLSKPTNPNAPGQPGVMEKVVSRGLLNESTVVLFETTGTSSGIKVVNQKSGKVSSMFKEKDFNFEKLGIGGLDAQFSDIFRRAFASRVFPPHVISKLGISHVKGMLLYGPPGTGKTLIARQIGKMLNGKEPKIVNGPEILDKFVGASEKNIRDLFADAEKEYKEHGDESDLHIIIFDEIDAICKSRGSTRDGTGVHDSIVNQLLTKIDGVDALNNILLIGMTNRRDMLDEALLRPGRLEVQIEIGLPDENGRLKIFQIHSKKMRENSFIGADVDLFELASRTQNFSGAEIEGLVKSAVSFGLNRQTNPNDLTKAVDEDNIKVNMADFESALKEVRPAFGANVKELKQFCAYGVLSCLKGHAHILSTALKQTEQVRTSEKTPLLSCLLEGDSGSGKTALAATIAMKSGFPFVKMLSAEHMVGMSEHSKCSHIAKVFDDAYKSPLAIIILDDIERLLEYVSIGPRFSNLLLQTLLVLVKKIPPEGHRLYVLGTTSFPSILQKEMHLNTAFNTVLSVPSLSTREVQDVLRSLRVVDESDVQFAAEALQTSVAGLSEQVTIKRLLLYIEMAIQGQAPGTKLSIDDLCDCLKDLA